VERSVNVIGIEVVAAFRCEMKFTTGGVVGEIT